MMRCPNCGHEIEPPRSVEPVRPPEPPEPPQAVPRSVVPLVLAESTLDLDLPARAWNCLHLAGIGTVGELVGLSKGDLLRIKNLGKVSLAEIVGELAKRGLSLREGA